MKVSLKKGKKLAGTITPPPDKSITHRALIVGALGVDETEIGNPLISGDTKSTVSCLLKLGKKISVEANRIMIEKGSLREPEEILDCGNSGTTARLLTGLLSSQEFFSVLDGDSSLKKRPMKRVVEPLRRMGAEIFGRLGSSCLPFSINGQKLHGIDYQLDLPSAQVKSAIILAGLFAEGKTTIRERIKTRDHLERLLLWLGADLEIQNNTVVVKQGSQISGGRVAVPGDISSAAFLMAAAVLLSGSRIILKNVGFNPTRLGFIKVLKRMGANISALDHRTKFNEEMADLEIKASDLMATDVEENEVPYLIDEIPLVALLATQAQGVTRIKGAGELRHKESDRLKSVFINLSKMGARIEEKEDGLIIEGPTPLKGAQLRSFGDHRIAMTMAVASLLAHGESDIEGFDWVEISYPNFLPDFMSLYK